jgi:hypothetical protein
MRSSKNIFQKAVTDAFTKQPNVQLNADTINDAMKYQQDMKENKKKVESQEATGASSAGQYSGPAIWAKSSSPKDWEPSRKPQYKGGEFVKVKGKCKRFPYCNQGDIKALKMWENKNVSEAIKSASKKLNLSETTIKAILQYEMENTTNKKG